MTLTLGMHGGKCCGIKTIYGLSVSPEHTLMKKLESKELSHDRLGEGFNVGCDFFAPSAPAETYGERFDRYVDYLRKRRPSHLIEVAIAVGPGYNQSVWIPFLEKRGFRAVTPPFLNSNSGNMCQVYHLIIKNGKTVAPK